MIYSGKQRSVMHQVLLDLCRLANPNCETITPAKQSLGLGD